MYSSEFGVRSSEWEARSSEYEGLDGPEDDNQKDAELHQ